MSFSEVFLIGSIISDRYQIIKRIGTGGSGKVYLAYDTKMADSPRAIKQLAVDFVDYDQYLKAIEDFKREVKVLSGLEHPSIPKIYDYFSAGGYYFLVMSYVGGKTLKQMLTQSPDGRVSEQTAAKWGIQLCDTLDYIHGLNPPIIYRDMKPANVMYDDSIDRVVLIDFGIARFVQSSAQLVTAIGSVGYAPPELYQGRAMPASDIYSLGATMYHFLTGISPSNNPMRGFDFSSNPRPRQINDKITETMENILLKAVEADPADRFACAREMKSALEEHLSSLDKPALSKPASDDEPIKEMSVFQTLKYPPKSWLSSTPSFESANAWLIIYRKTRKVGEVRISNPELIIGRIDKKRGVAPDLDLTVFDGSGNISRKHARIKWEKGDFYFEDLGSSNGSSYNGQKVEPHKRVLMRNGDYINIGETEIEFLLG